MRLKLTKSQIATYQTSGCICIRDAFSEHWIDTLREGVERNLKNPSKNFRDFSPDGSPGGFISDMWAWPDIPEYINFVKNSCVGELGARLNLKSSTVFMEDNFFIKQPLTALPTPWHQDLPYYEVEGDMWSVWIPLDSHVKIDCLELIAGSHLWGKKYLPLDFKVADVGPAELESDNEQLLPVGYERLPDFDDPTKSYSIISWDMNPGDCIVFDARTIHGNRSTKQNQGGSRISFRFVDENTIFAPDKYPWSDIGIEHKLKAGEPFSGELFPMVWRQ